MQKIKVKFTSRFDFMKNRELFVVMVYIIDCLAEVDKSEPIKPTPAPPQSGIISSGNILGIIATVGGALFICNLCLLYCYVKRRAGKHIFGESFNHIKISCFQARPLPTLDILWSIVYWKRSQKFPSL